MAETVNTISGPLHLTRIDELPAKAPVSGDFMAICPAGGPANSATIGAIIQAGMRALGTSLDDLTDVDLSGIALADGRFLAYDNTKKVWVPFELSLSTIPGLHLAPGQMPLAGDTFSYRNGTWNLIPGVDRAYVDSKLTSLMALQPAVANHAALPLTGNNPGDVRVTTDSSSMNMWDGGAWVSIGKASTAIPAGINESDTLAWDSAALNWTVHKPMLADLGDVDLTTAQKAGQLLSWDTAGGGKWKPKTVAVPAALTDLTDVDKSAPATGQILVYNQTTSLWEPKTHSHALTSLTDVESGIAPAEGNFLTYDAAASKWVPKATSVYTKLEVDKKLEILVIGLEHGQAVQSITNNPPPAPVPFEFYIVGKAPTGAWVGQANAVTWWDGAKWSFQSPQSGETHLVQNVAETWSWSGTAWNKVASALTGGGGGAGSTGDLWLVGAIQQSVLTEPQFKTLLDAAEQLKWVLADGRDVTGSRYATVTGSNTVPDLRGAFLRGSGTNKNPSWVGGALGAYQEDSTARPKTAFTGTTGTDGAHTHTANPEGYYASKSSSGTWAIGSPVVHDGQDGRMTLNTSTAGAHSHNVTINGGGDSETRPKSYGINYFVKVN